MTVPQVRPQPVPQPLSNQRVQNIVSDIKTVPPQVRPPQGQINPRLIAPQPTTVINGPPPQIPQGAKQFTQSV